MAFNSMYLHGVTKIEIKEDKFTTFTSFDVTATDKDGNEFKCSFFVDAMEELEYTNEVVIGKRNLTELN
jgi:hypothetical protein